MCEALAKGRENWRRENEERRAGTKESMRRAIDTNMNTFEFVTAKQPKRPQLKCTFCDKRFMITCVCCDRVECSDSKAKQ